MFETQPPLPHRWRLDGNYLMGITSDRWWSLLRQNQFHVAPAYWHRAIMISLTSALSSALSALESWRYGSAVKATEIETDPTFILGHWRSGTTLLHELLALDTERWACPTTFDVMSPQTFLLITSPLFRAGMRPLVPRRRPMDNMQLGVGSPQEDEFAIALLSQQSYYCALAFPEAEQHYERYLTLQDLTPAELNRWRTTFIYFLKKLTLKYGRPLLLKSPTHTARIKLLLQLFPNAKFIHIHRHPEAVFQSMAHYFNTAGWLTCVQKQNLDTLTESILRRYTMLYDAYFEQRSLIPPGQFYELSFSALQEDAIAQIQSIYQALNWPYSPAFDAKMRQYLQARDGYRKNTFSALDPTTHEQIQQRWQRAFLTWGYKPSGQCGSQPAEAQSR